MNLRDEFPCPNIEYYLPYPFLRDIPIQKKYALWIAEQESYEKDKNGIFLKNASAKVLCRKLTWDSTYFSKEIYKIDVLTGEREDLTQLVTELMQILESRGADYCFINIPVEDITGMDALGVNGWSVIEARATYFIEKVQQFTPLERFEIELAGKNHTDELMRVAAETVNQFDRFHADTFFSAHQTDQFMKKFVQASIEEGFADFVLIPKNEAKAFMTGKTLNDQWHIIDCKISQLVLSAVSPEMRGWYKKLVSEGLIYLRERKADVVFLTTQLGNKAVIKTWERIGFSFGSSTLVLRRKFGR